MSFKFTVKASDLNAALDLVLVLTPRAINKEKASGVLFVINGPTGGHLYSRDDARVARCRFDVTDVEGEGAFVYNAQHLSAFRTFKPEEQITFTVGTEEGAFTVSYTTSAGRKAEKPSFSPKAMQSCDRDLEEAQKTPGQVLPVATLLSALRLSGCFTSDAKGAEDKHLTVQLFDKDHESPDPKNPGQSHKPYEKGDGHIQATDGMRLFDFYSDALAGQSFAILAPHLGTIQSFLTKCTGNVTLNTGKNMTFATDSEGRVLGWNHSAARLAKFSSYAYSSDHIVLMVNRAAVMAELKYASCELDEKREKIKFVLDAASSSFSFQVAEGNSKATGVAIPFTFKDETKEKRDVAINVNLGYFESLFKDSTSNEIMLRITIVAPGDKRAKESGMFRTIDEYVVDAEGKVIGGSGVEKKPEGAVTCKVTRFITSMV